MLKTWAGGVFNDTSVSSKIILFASYDFVKQNLEDSW